MRDKTIYDLALHEQMTLDTKHSESRVLRVPGGWVYISHADSSGAACFVPYNKEFKPEDLQP